MGLLREIVLLPFAPVRGVLWSVRQVLDVAELERAEGIKRELVELEQALEHQEITEEEFDAREDELLEELDHLDRGDSALEAPR
jgi:hypothetical protein